MSCNNKDNNNIPRCQRIQNEYKENLHHLKEVINAVNNDESISFEDFKKCMEFVYREGWGDCFMWQGEVPGKETLEEFLNILNIDRYGR